MGGTIGGDGEGGVVMELLRTILIWVLTGGFLFSISYLIDIYLRRKHESARNNTKKSIIVGVVSSVVTLLVLFLLRMTVLSTFPVEDDDKGLPSYVPRSTIAIAAYFITPVVILIVSYLLIFLGVRKLCQSSKNSNFFRHDTNQ